MPKNINLFFFMLQQLKQQVWNTSDLGESLSKKLQTFKKSSKNLWICELLVISKCSSKCFTKRFYWILKLFKKLYKSCWTSQIQKCQESEFKLFELLRKFTSKWRNLHWSSAWVTTTTSKQFRNWNQSLRNNQSNSFKHFIANFSPKYLCLSLKIIRFFIQ